LQLAGKKAGTVELQVDWIRTYGGAAAKLSEGR
jgi:hypothetical protein